MFEKIEINDQFKTALNFIHKNKPCIFITGKAGTGKSTLLEYFRENTKKNTAILAPTGVSALNIKGQTIHSFFKFKPNVTIQAATKSARKMIKIGDDKLYRELDTLVIDEISMVRSDLLDSVDVFLRIVRKDMRPFGGVQMVMFGDLYQLPPVVTSNEKHLFSSHYKSPFFFDSKVFEDIKPEFVELDKIYRQKDEGFIQILNGIRNNTITEEDIDRLNFRCDPEFLAIDDFYIYLATTNKKVSEINKIKLAGIRGKSHFYEGKIDGDFDNSVLPTDMNLELKVGAQVMLLNNDSFGRWVNGSIGKIVSCGKFDVEVELDDSSVETVEPYNWEMFNYELGKDSKTIFSNKVGSLKQLPIKLAWAVTIHKSQGKTFDKVIIDLENGTFATGQAYVALSRCRTLDGIILKHEFKKKHILVDRRVMEFLTTRQYNISEEKMPFEEKMSLIKNAIKNKQKLEIIYLKTSDEKSKRIIKPKNVGEEEYRGKKFIGLLARCYNRDKDRTFRVDRILEMKVKE